MFPEKEASKPQVRSVRRFLTEAGIEKALIADMLQHNGYCGRVEFDDEAGVFHGEVLGLRDVVTFEATNVRDLRKAFRDSVDDYVAFCEEQIEQAIETPLG